MDNKENTWSDMKVMPTHTSTPQYLQLKAAKISSKNPYIQP